MANLVVREDEDSRIPTAGGILVTVGPDGVEACREVDYAVFPAVLQERFGIAMNSDDPTR